MIARDYRTESVFSLETNGGSITRVEPVLGSAACDPGRELWIAPSFFDVQINGGLGVGFNSPKLTTEGVRTVVEECRRHGIGQLLATVITDGFEPIRRAFEVLSRARCEDATLKARLPGFHLEGPYISGNEGYRGAHPQVHARNPDYDEFRRWQDAADGLIRMVTLAPERPGAMKFIEQLRNSGVLVALGHTAANHDQIRAAVDAGASLSTHLGNGCPAMLPRHDNPIWDQLADDRLCASLITDGHHVPVNFVKSVVRVKTPAKLILTCDASSLAGLPHGRYTDWGSEVDVQSDGKVVLAGTPYLAGGGRFTDRCVSNMMRMANVTLAEAITMASIRPRELMGLPVPQLAVGVNLSDFVVFEWRSGEDLSVIDTVD